MSGQPHAPNTLLLRKDPWYSLHRRLCGPLSQSGCFGEGTDLSKLIHFFLSSSGNCLNYIRSHFCHSTQIIWWNPLNTISSMRCFRMPWRNRFKVQFNDNEFSSVLPPQYTIMQQCQILVARFVVMCRKPYIWTNYFDNWYIDTSGHAVA